MCVCVYIYIYIYIYIKSLGFPYGSVVENPLGNASEAGSIAGSGRSPGERNGNHSRIIAWEIPRTEKSGSLQSMGSQKSQTRFSD